MAARKPEVHHVVPRFLLTLHQKASGTELDGEGIQAWLEWEMEALMWGVPIEISWDELEALVAGVPPEGRRGVECPLSRSPGTSSEGPANHF